MTARRRVLLLVAGLALLALAVLLPSARADVFGNVAPASQLPSGALADAYPLGRYLLDHHFDAVKAGVLSGVDVSGIPPTIAWFLAQLFWQLTAFLANAVITLFTFAFSLDLVNGSGATGGNGALEPVAEAVQTIYRDIFGAAWMTVAVLLAGMWAIWNALVRRRYTETAGALATSVVFVVIALAFVTQPERTIGTASKWTNQMSGAFLSLSANGTITDHAEAKRQVGDQLFKTLIYDPWVVLNFGGLEHCVRDADSNDPTTVPVRPLSRNASRDAQLARQLRQGQQIEADGKVCINNANKYAPHFLRFDFHSDQRNAEYEALKAGDAGKLPDEDPGKRDGTYRLGPADKPAADAMGKDGQYDRLGLALVIFAGELGAFLLIGSLSVAVILAQVLVLLLLAFAPVALVVGIFPKRGHEFFIGWLQRLAAFLLRKAIYSLILAVLLAVAAALAQATGSLGWLMAFGLQAVFFWTVFVYRKQLTGQLSTAVTGTSGQREERRIGGILALYAAGRLTRRAIRHLPRRGRDEDQQPPAPPAPSQPPQPPPPTPTPDRDGPDRDAPSGERTRDPHYPDRADRDRESRSSATTSRLPPDPGRDHAPAPSRPPRARRVGGEAGAGVERPADAPASTDAEPVAPPTADAAHRPAPTSTAPGAPRPPSTAAPRPASTAASSAPKPAREPPTPAAPTPAATAAGSSRPAQRGGESPLLSGLRRDAQRIHHDAARLHEDARQMGERPGHDAPRPAPPAPPPRATRRAPSPPNPTTTSGGEGS